MKKFILFASLIPLLCACNRSIRVASPDNHIQLTFALSTNGEPTYSVQQDGQQIVAPSAMGLTIAPIAADAEEQTLTDILSHAISLQADWQIIGSESSSADQTWETVWGEDRFIRDQHNRTIVHLKHATGILMDIALHAANDGIAFRYLFPEQTALDSFVVLDESTSYAFPTATQAWSIPWRTEYYEALWQKDLLAQKDTMCSPITLELPNGRYAFLHEAALADYPAQNFYLNEGSVHTFLTPYLTHVEEQTSDGQPIHLLTESPVKAYVRAPFATPWRMIVVARNLSDMMASRLMLNLNEPCRISDTSWIKPMKFIGIWWGMHLKQWTWRMGPQHGATTEHMQQYLQFAADHHLGGVLAEGWNKGWEGYEGIDPTARFQFDTPYPDYDMDYLANFAHEHGVQIISHHETSGAAAQYEHEMADAYRYMQDHGVTAVKTGYVAPRITTLDGVQYNRSQAGVRHYRHVIECAAAHHVCIDNHEPVMPTGLQRTFPNLMTQEGIRGQEWNAWSRDGGSPASHVCTLPFTRMMAGPADYTPGVFGFENPVYPETRVHATLTNQLALFVTMYSPLQMACDLIENYTRFPDAFTFIEHVPCDWNQSRLLEGEIGEYVVMARQDRNSDNWYIGATTNDTPRDINLSLSFLDADKQYQAIVYRDGEGADWRTAPYDYHIDSLILCPTHHLPLSLASGGGCAVELIPIAD